MFGFYEDPDVSKAYLVLENAGEKTLTDFISQGSVEGSKGPQLRDDTVRDIMK